MNCRPSRLLPLAVCSLLCLSTASWAAVDLVGTWTWTYKCKGYQAGFESKYDGATTLTVLSQTGNELAAQSQGGVAYNGLVFENGAKPGRGAVVLFTDGIDSSLSGSPLGFEALYFDLTTKENGTAKMKGPGANALAAGAGSYSFSCTHKLTLNPSLP